MRDLAGVRAFLEGEIAALEAFEFVAVGPAGTALHRLEIVRSENGDLKVQLPGRFFVLPALEEAEQTALAELGFESEDAGDRTKPWVNTVDTATNAVTTTERVLQDVFNEKPDIALDVVHGSHRAAHEARVKLAALCEQVEQLITEALGSKPEHDSDQDFVLPVGDVQITVAPRVLPGIPPMVRIFAVTNVGVAVVPELGLQLARLNFGLMFGRFALDVEHSSIWFDATLFGDQLNTETIKFAIRMVAATADEWDDRLKQMFGGMKFREAMSDGRAHEPPPKKPGEAPQDGRGLYL